MPDLRKASQLAVLYPDVFFVAEFADLFQRDARLLAERERHGTWQLAAVFRRRIADFLFLFFRHAPSLLSLSQTLH
jgi:hypothetical protein